jgi:hypothetical protein
VAARTPEARNAAAPQARQAQPSSSPAELSADAARQDVRILVRALQTLHPALTKYRTQAEIDAAFARFEARGQAARTATEMYLAASELAAAIRCGHTWTNVLNQKGPIKSALLESADKLPFTLTLVENRWLILASADADVKAGDELVSVEGIDAPAMVSRLMPYLRADGSSDGKRLQQLNHDRLDFSQMDILWPLLVPPVEGRYRIDVRRPDGRLDHLTVKTTTMAARDAAIAAQGVPPMRKDWSLRIDGEMAVLSMPGFVFRNDAFDWAAYIEKTIADLNTRKIRNLVVDIRANEGGDGAIGGKLLAHIVSQPLRFVSSQSVSTYERVPYALARYLDTWDYGFFDRTGQVEKITEGTAAGKYRYLPSDEREQVIEPAAPHFEGRVFMLIGPENSSAAFQLALLARQSREVTLVGQRTGGNFRGLNGGELAWVNLPNSGVAVDIPLLAARYTQDTPDGSVEPDVPVKHSYAARAAGRDLDMEAVRNIIGTR